MINQQVTITIIDGYAIEFEREHRTRGEDPGAWYKKDKRHIDKISKASLHRLIRVVDTLGWEHNEHTSWYMGGYYAPDCTEYDYFTLSKSSTGKISLANWLRQLCGCSECWSDETGAIPSASAVSTEAVE